MEIVGIACFTIGLLLVFGGGPLIMAVAVYEENGGMVSIGVVIEILGALLMIGGGIASGM